MRAATDARVARNGAPAAKHAHRGAHMLHTPSYKMTGRLSVAKKSTAGAVLLVLLLRTAPTARSCMAPARPAAWWLSVRTGCGIHHTLWCGTAAPSPADRCLATRHVRVWLAALANAARACAPAWLCLSGFACCNHDDGMMWLESALIDVASMLLWRRSRGVTLVLCDACVTRSHRSCWVVVDGIERRCTTPHAPRARYGLLHSVSR
jgi:hypothetical protein